MLKSTLPSRPQSTISALHLSSDPMTAASQPQSSSAKPEELQAQIVALGSLIRNGSPVSKKVIDDVAKKAPQAAEWWLKLLPLYHGIKAYDRIERVSEQILEVSPGEISVRVELVKLLDKNKSTIQLDGDYERSALRHLNVLTGLPALSGEDWIKISDCFSSRGDYSSATTAAQRAIDLLDGEDRLRARLLLVQAALGCDDRALARSELQLMRSSLRFESIVKTAVLYERLGASQDALIVAQRALTFSMSVAESPLSYLDLVQIFMKIKRVEDARPLMLKIGKINVSYFEIAKRFSDVCFNLQLDELSRFYAQRALSFSPYDLPTKNRLEILRLTGAPPKSQSPQQSPPTLARRLADIIFLRRAQ